MPHSIPQRVQWRLTAVPTMLIFSSTWARVSSSLWRITKSLFRAGRSGCVRVHPAGGFTGGTAPQGARTGPAEDVAACPGSPRSGCRRRPVGAGTPSGRADGEERPGPGAGSGRRCFPWSQAVRCRGAAAGGLVGLTRGHLRSLGPPTRRAAPRGANSHLAPRTTKPRRTEPSSRGGFRMHGHSPRMFFRHSGGDFSQRSLGEDLRRRRRAPMRTAAWSGPRSACHSSNATPPRRTGHRAGGQAGGQRR